MVAFASLAIILSAKSNASNTTHDKVFSTENVIVSMSGPQMDLSRTEVIMKLAGYSLEIPQKFDFPANRSLILQIYKPKNIATTKLPVILFSGGWSEDFRLYSTVLKSISSRGYFFFNIDHYYHQNSKSHSVGFDHWVKEQRKNSELESQKMQQENFMRTKMALLEIYKKDILFIMDRLPEILKTEPNANLSQLILMGHSIGGNADKAVIEQLFKSDATKERVMAFVSFDSRLNQLGLKTVFEIPTLLLGASSWYSGKKDPLRELPKQTNLRLKVLDHTTHVSFDDVAIFSMIGRDLEPLKYGMNEFAKQELDVDIIKIKNGNTQRFGEELFLGDRKETIAFINDLSSEVDDFIKNLSLQGFRTPYSTYEKDLADVEASSGGHIGVSAIDTSNHRILNYHAEEKFQLWSTFKLFLAAAVLKNSMMNPKLLSERIHYTKSDVELAGYAPITITEKNIKEGLTVA